MVIRNHAWLRRRAAAWGGRKSAQWIACFILRLRITVVGRLAVVLRAAAVGI
jgi:hypothetical protein